MFGGPFLHSGLDKWAIEKPGHPAVIEYSAGAVSTTYTYGELLDSVKSLEQHIYSLGIRKNSETLVLVWANPVDSVLAFHAVSRSGNAYIPCDANTPGARVQSIIEQAKPAIILASDKLLQHQDSIPGTRLVSINNYASQRHELVAAEEAGNVPVLTEDSLGFVVFTSGTTGTPKGVALSHKNYLNRIYWLWETFPAAEVCCLNSSTNFIDAACEMFGALGTGSSLLVLTPEQVRNPTVLCDSLRIAKVESILCVPTLVRMMLLGTENKGGLSRVLPDLQTWFLSGEALPIDLLASLFTEYPDSRVINVWGASEANDATAVIMTKEDIQRYKSRNMVLSPIGRALKGCGVLIIRDQQVVPEGEVGELWVFGNSVARGYLNNPESTAERFITFDADFFAQEWTFDVSSGKVRGFNTGDLGRIDEDGNILCLGRNDHQIKVRGNRVNILEVEAALRTIVIESGFSDLVVVAWTTEGITSLGAAIAPEDGDLTLLRVRMKERLPSYFIPSKVIALPIIPRGSTGKVDREGIRRQMAALTERACPGRNIF